MLDLEYQRIIEDCFKQQIVCPVGLSDEISFEPSEQEKNKNKIKERLQRKLEERRKYF